MRFLKSMVVGSMVSTAVLMACGGGGSTSGTGGGGGSAPVCDAPSSPAAFELGTGVSCFERIEAGQTLPVNDGPQGGYHLWVAFGCADCSGKTIVEFGAKDKATKAWLNGLPSKVAVTPNGQEWKQFAGLTAFLPGDDFSNQNDRLPKGTHVLLSLRILDANGVEKHAAETEVILGDDQTSACSNASTCGAEGMIPCCSNGNGL